jgi:hypothetical protein
MRLTREKSEAKYVGQVVGPFRSPVMEYESDYVFYEDLRKLDQYLNAKGEQLWHLQTIEQMQPGKYFVVWFRIKGELPPHARD